MERAQSELERFKSCESFGMWEFCGYFMSKDIHTTALSGNVYKALMTGDNSNVESAHLNVWSINQAEAINQILEYILHFSHPQAEMPAFEGGYTKQIVTPTNLVSGNELPLVMGFPKKSVSGLAVVEMADFGRAVVYENQVPERKIDFGNIYHMGITEDTRVNMDLDLLASHCFITGSSGSGKSYATYQLLESVIENNVKIMIIEPAKGEYKQIFGGLKGIKIFTTDPNTYRVLKINPFQFPDNIHLLSHIEQLLQIFNASWPLYAAMPAILKQAVVEAYMKCGWDVQNSIWIPGISDHKYPVFADVLELLPQIINTSDYSADSKGDYKGALVTRVQSMTVGINGVIFKNRVGKEVEIGKSIRISTLLEPSIGEVPKLIFKVRDEKIASCDGLAVYGLQEGIGVLEVYKLGSKKPFFTKEIKVFKRNRITRLILSEDSLCMGIGDKKHIRLDYYPLDADNSRSISWESSNENIIKVDSSGNVTAIGIGECRLICTAENISSQCMCRVKPYLSDLKLDLQFDEKGGISMQPLQELSMSIQCIPEDSIDSEIIVESADLDIVNVVKKTLYAKNAGTTTITLKNSSARIHRSFQVTVSKKGLFKTLFG